MNVWHWHYIIGRQDSFIPWELNFALCFCFNIQFRVQQELTRGNVNDVDLFIPLMLYLWQLCACFGVFSYVYRSWRLYLSYFWHTLSQNSWPNLCRACLGLHSKRPSPWKGQNHRYEATLGPRHLWTPAILAASAARTCPSSSKWQWALTICESFPTNWVTPKMRTNRKCRGNSNNTSSNGLDRCGKVLDKFHNEECCRTLWTRQHIPNIWALHTV